MPTLYVLAGANGSGKTTWYTAALQNGFINADLPFVNVDLIARDELGGYNETNLAKAQMVARERIATYFNGRVDFMIESNLAVQSDYNWIEALIKRGYVAVLYFLGTSDININYARVSKRIKEGGHAVPENIISHRYKMGISYLKSKILIFEQAYLIDNSMEYAQEIAIIQHGQLLRKAATSPDWANELLFIVERLSGNK